ncbi:MAG: alpha-hydroxy-acid oxidizing protein [Bryobacterales bacterium]|nr:alpha-hydroxy-acid oxidizing protein [Bryobacterales bacterium]
MNRRDALRNTMMWMAGSPLLRAQEVLGDTRDRFPAIDDLVNVFEFEPILKSKVPKNNYDFIAGGVDAEWTMRRNRESFDRITFRPRFMRDVSKMDLSTELFGQKISMPILVAPTAGHQLAHEQGELATARGAGQMKTIMAVSTNSSYPIDKIGAAATGPLWFQLYVGPDWDGTRDRVERAVGAGCKAVCVTLDSAYGSHRERLLRNRTSAGPVAVPSPGGRRGAAPREPLPYKLQSQFTAHLTWSFLDEINKYAKVPVLLKGILTAEDAKLAVERGAAGIIVSNHGGRYLEYAPSTIEVLPEIVEAVGGRIPVLIDSGFRRGTDILKALAIGAKAVLIGRPPLWGLGAYGQAGVAKVLELLQHELALSMGLAGATNLAAIDRKLVKIDAR